MPDRAVPPDPQRLNDFIAECILALEQRGEAAMEELLAGHPDVADRARSRIRSLQASGLLGEPDPDPERIGPYRVRERLGSGGMGTVYLAEQDGDLERRVAIKVVKRGMDSREVLARFALERQALAMLDHQNIAKVLDAGQTDDGRPFLVMEYVAGLPITRYCDERRLPLAARIELFCLVCEAVQHAHHKGLIHRDLKPSNILVADRAGRPWPIVIDFGVAKSLGTGVSAQSLVTARGRVLGTPEYMSPEQAANDMDVDTRADVFSLGVVLYELLTGTLPIDSPTLRRADSGELPRILRTFDTPAPSRRVTRLDAADAAAAVCRQTDVPQLRRHLRGDLDWITLRALERDRNRRYGMPGELAADLQRHLRNEPVLAGPPGTLYRWNKFVARNRLQVVSAAIVLVTLLGGLWFSLAAYRAAAASARQSDLDFDNALGAIERLVFFGDQRLVDEPQMDEVRRHLLEDALDFYKKVATGRSEAPRLQLRVAQAAARVARIQRMLGDDTAALASIDQAKKAFAALPTELQPLETVAFLDLLAGQCLMSRGRYADAENALRWSVAAFAKLAKGSGAESQVARGHLAAAGQLARVVLPRDQVGALKEFEAAMALAEPWLSDTATDAAAKAAALAIAVQHATLLARIGQTEGARERAESLRTPIVQEWERRSEPQRQELVGTVQELASLFSSQGAFDNAEDLLELAVAQQRWVCATHPAQVSGLRSLGIALSTLADVQLPLGQSDRARASIAEAVAVFEQQVVRSPATVDRELLAKVVINQARILEQPRRLGGEADGAAIEAALQRGIGLLEGLPSEVRRMRDLRVPLASAWALRAANHGAAGRSDAALAAMERTVGEGEALVAAEPQLIDLRRNLVGWRGDLAELLLTAGQWQRVLVLADQIEADAAAVEAASPLVLAGSFALQVSRLRMRARAGLGDVDGVVAEVRRPAGIERDWKGSRVKAEALLLLVEHLPADHPQRMALLGEARDLLQQALGFGGGGNPADMQTMVQVMAAQTSAVLVQVERAAGDLRAAAAAAEAVVLCYEPSLRARDSNRNRERLFQAGEVWLQALADLQNGAGLCAGVERLGQAFDAHGAELLRLAATCARLSGAPGLTGDAGPAVAAAGVRFLRRCLDLGAADLAAIRGDAALAPLRSHPDWAAVRANRR